jgi:hypothetical protein
MHIGMTDSAVLNFYQYITFPTLQRSIVVGVIGEVGEELLKALVFTKVMMFC